MSPGHRVARTTLAVFIVASLVAIGIILASRAGLIDLPSKYDPFALPDLDETPHWLTQVQLKLIDADAGNCSFALARTGLSTRLKPSRSLGTSCEIEWPITLVKLSRATMRAEDTRCNIAARLYMWEKHDLQPAAQRFFNEPIIEILHFGSYSCRTIAGSSHMSEHANANAFDISGFRLRNGKVISVLNNWSTTSTESKFLHVARDSACDYFNLTLSPDYNAAHRDHFHVDMGWVRGCR